MKEGDIMEDVLGLWNPFRQYTPGTVRMGGRTPAMDVEAYRMGTYMKYQEEILKAVPKAMEFPKMAQEGTSEAMDTINRSMEGQMSIQERVLQNLEAAKIQRERQLQVMNETLDALRMAGWGQEPTDIQGAAIK